MRKVAFLLFVFITTCSSAQKKPATSNLQPATSKPKLVVGIVIDQMRWDYLYRFLDAYKATGGFKRLLGEGFSCDNTFIPYLPTVTACGHACAYTGSVPAINGITGNTWWDNNLGKTVYCVEDKSVLAVGNNKAEDGQMSPRNLFVRTVTDELRLASNFRSKTIGISMKDRGAVLPAGHAANAAYWYDGKAGNFITSTYYMKALPDWLQKFNERKLVDSFYQKGWDLSMDKQVYEKLCDTNYNSYVKHKFGNDSSGFPYSTKQFAGKDYSKILTTPYGNDILAEMAKKLIAAEQMGKHDATDFLAISFSSTDYVGHDFGPNSWEILDTYARLDATLGSLLDYLDKNVGKNQYTIFLTADHAAPPVPEFLNKHSIPGGRIEDGNIKGELNELLKKQTSVAKLVNHIYQFNIYLNHALIDSAKLDEASIKKTISQYLLKKEAVLQVVDTENPNNVPAKISEMIVNGHNPQRSGDLIFITKPSILSSGRLGISHGLWNNDDSHIPLLFYGWGIKHGSLKRETYMTDIAATVAALLKIQMPNGSVGKVIEEVMK
jgi:predicted AlkP superfamily pyrophosphatase or phosphodiesterase